MAKRDITQRNASFALLAIVAASLLTGFFSASIYRSYSGDEQNYMFGAYLETQGLHAYKDYFNNIQKTPGTLWMLMPFIWIFGNGFGSLIAARVFQMLLKSATTVIIYYLGVRIFKSRVSGIAAAAAFAFSAIVMDSAHIVGTYPGPLLLYSLALYSYLSDWRYRHFLTGLLCGLMVLFRIDAGLIGVVFGAFILARSFRAAAWYSIGAVAGVLPLFIFIAINNSWTGFYRAVFVFTRYYPPVSFDMLDRILRLAAGLRYDFHLVILLAAAMMIYLWSRPSIKDFKASNIAFFLSVLALTQFIFILFYPKLVFPHYLNLVAVPACLIAGQAFALLLKRARSIAYAAAAILAISAVVFFFFPFQPINNRDAIMIEQMRSYPHSTVFTDSEQVMLLLGKTDPIYVGKSNHWAYEQSRLNEIMHSPSLDELRANFTRYDLVYLNSYEGITAPGGYKKVCAPERRKSLIFYVGDVVKGLGLQGILMAPSDLSIFEECSYYYYVRS